ncbi:chemotaxis protein CheW [Pseudomonas stutzeri]|jgi:chemosensory pili system protein ChpC|uniref:chemotaxis protein CheW n=1 Tax=unclassified Pseudomonas TaxID=196821 RepID=UPI0010FF71D0|nr:chemotaxis protein CheW [Pseudomonas sp.]MCQ4235861.1 chemotaxis protein CheW [Stutzerimonas degradans]MCQ4268987.1 chemotaxis protein CheW [Stutzerimonas degradans]MDT3712111.1 chemotaxis protein CheW [Pseudomonadaceae bacterium]QCT98547.1 chemotaxis protein CheW [Stutzerimonas degradans]
MSQAVVSQESPVSLTGLLVPLADRTLLVPNVAVAELIPYRTPQAVPGAPAWFLGQVQWRDLNLPLLSFEAASDGATLVGTGARIVVLNALGGREHVRFIALLVQGIPRSIKVDADLARAELALAPLELEAVELGDVQARIPDLVGLEQCLADAGLI